MTEGGFYEPRRLSPTGMTVVVLLHGAAIAALMTAKMDVTRHTFDPTRIFDVPIPPPPPPPSHDIPKQQSKPVQDSHVTTTPPIVEHPVDSTINFPPLPPAPPSPPIGPTVGTGPIVEPPPPPPPPRKLEPARARANLGSYVSDADYPDAAIRSEEQGTTRFRLAVGPDGRVTDCTVTGSSGSSALDAATCRLMKSRARFTPARDSNGNPTTDSVASSIRWVLPAG